MTVIGREGSSLQKRFLERTIERLTELGEGQLNVTFAQYIPWGGQSIQNNKPPKITYPQDAESCGKF